MDENQEHSQSLDSNVAVVIPAAGVGERVGSDNPKQFNILHGQPIIALTVECFTKLSYISSIVVVTNTLHMDNMKEALQACNNQRKIHIVPGLESRHKSIFAGLKKLQSLESSPEIVVIHDGVRPYVPFDLLQEIIQAAKTFGAAGAVRPLVSTVIKPDEEKFLETHIPRSDYLASEMPQAFNFSSILEAYSKCSEEELIKGTECLAVAKLYSNIKVKLIETNCDLWKITYKKDLEPASISLQANRPIKIVCKNSANSNFEAFIKKEIISQMPPPNLEERNSSFEQEDHNIVVINLQESLADIIDIHLNSTHSRPRFLCSYQVYIGHIPQSSFIYLHQQAILAAKVASNAKRVLFFIGVLIENISLERMKKIARVTIDLLNNPKPSLSGQIFFL